MNNYHSTMINFPVDTYKYLKDEATKRGTNVTQYLIEIIKIDMEHTFNNPYMPSNKKIVFKNSANAIYDEELLISAIEWFTNGNYRKSMSVYRSNKISYPGVFLYGKHFAIHILLMMYKLKTKNLNGNIVHHRDENRLNADIDNLELMTKEQHLKLHNTGKYWSRARKNKASQDRKGKYTGGTGRYRKDIDSADIFKMYESGFTFKEIATHFHTDRNTISFRYTDYCNQNGLHKHKENRRRKEIPMDDIAIRISNNETYSSIAKIYNIHPTTLSYKYRNYLATNKL